MSPEALALATHRVRLNLKDQARLFERTVAQRQAELSTGGMGVSSVMVMQVLELARAELEQRALGAWEVCRRLLDADDAEPGETSRAEVMALIRTAVAEWSTDIDEVYQKRQERMRGTWPTLDDARERALALAASEVDIDFLRRGRKRIPISDALRAPRYASCNAHWSKARSMAEGDPPDVPNAVKEGASAIEALAKIILQHTCATLGDCIKELRSRKLLDPGSDKLLEGLWAYANAAPGVRHGSPAISSLSESDWQVLRPMFEGALTLLLTLDAVS